MVSELAPGHHRSEVLRCMVALISYSTRIDAAAYAGPLTLGQWQKLRFGQNKPI